jgi:hypothetical protein
MGAFIPQAGGARGAAFAVASAVLFAVLAVLWLLAARGDRPEYRRPSRLFVAGTAACAALLAVTALLPAGARVPAWGLIDVAYLAGFSAILVTTDTSQTPAMVSLVDHAHASRTPAATAWVLCGGTAVVLGATILRALTLQVWDRDRGLYRPVARAGAAVAVACLVLGAARPAPLVLGLALVLLLSIPWGLAVARKLAGDPGD